MCFGTALRVFSTSPSFPCLSTSKYNGNIVSARDNADAYQLYVVRWRYELRGFYAFKHV